MEAAINLWRRTAGYRTDMFDGAVAALFVVAGLLTLLGLEGSDAGFRNVDVLAVGLLLVQTAPLAVRRRWPIGAFVTQLFGGLIPYASAGYAQDSVGLLAILVAFFTVVERSDLKRSLLMLTVAGAGVLIFYQVGRDPVDSVWRAALDVIVSFGAAFLLGTWVRTRCAQGEADHAELERLEADQERQTRAAIAEERASIARELHDAVGHALNLVVIQAGAAQRVLSSQPEVAEEALAAIEVSGRRALTDMDRMLGILREQSDNGAESSISPGLDGLDALIEETRNAGLPVEKVVDGEPARLPQTVDMSVYRIVQEALTNTLKHAGPASVEVHVRYLERAVEVEITDDGRGGLAEKGRGRASSGNSHGRGLVGMRERVRLFRGELETGPRPSGGYRVRARLPLEEHAR